MFGSGVRAKAYKTPAWFVPTPTSYDDDDDDDDYDFHSDYNYYYYDCYCDDDYDYDDYYYYSGRRNLVPTCLGPGADLESMPVAPAEVAWFHAP